MIKLPKEILYRYTIEEDVMNAITHGIGALFAYIGTLVLVSNASRNQMDTSVVIALAVYGSSMTTMFLMSCLYHSIFHDTTRSIFKRLDHAAIYLMISGTYAPISVIIGTKLAYMILTLVYLFSIAGIIIKVFYAGRFKKISTVIYILLGWMAIFEVNALLDTLNTLQLSLLILGGVIYTVGAIIYAISKFKYHHGVWHILVVLAAVCHFAMLFSLVS